MEVKSGRTGLPATVTNVVQAPTEADHGSLVQARLAAKQQRYSTCCVAVTTKESIVRVLGNKAFTGILTRKNRRTSAGFRGDADSEIRITEPDRAP